MTGGLEDLRTAPSWQSQETDNFCPTTTKSCILPATNELGRGLQASDEFAVPANALILAWSDTEQGVNLM